MVEADTEALGVRDAAAGQERDRRTGVLVVVVAELRILDAREVTALFILRASGLSAHADGRTRPAEDVGEAGLLDRDVIEPELAGRAAPHAEVDADFFVGEAVERDGDGHPVRCLRH